MGVLNLNHQLPAFTELSVEELQNYKVEYSFIAQYDVSSVKQLDESTFFKVHEEQLIRAVWDQVDTQGLTVMPR